MEDQLTEKLIDSNKLNMQDPQGHFTGPKGKPLVGGDKILLQGLPVYTMKSRDSIYCDLKKKKSSPQPNSILNTLTNYTLKANMYNHSYRYTKSK